MNSCVAFCRRYMHAASTALYSPSDFGRPVRLFHGFIERLVHSPDEFLHLREHQAGGTIIAQRFSGA